MTMMSRADPARVSHRAIPRTWSRGDRYLAVGIVAMAKEMGLRARWRVNAMPIMVITGPRGTIYATLRNHYESTGNPDAIAACELLAAQGYATYAWRPDDYSTGKVRTILRGCSEHGTPRVGHEDHRAKLHRQPRVPVLERHHPEVHQPSQQGLALVRRQDHGLHGLAVQLRQVPGRHGPEAVA